MPFADVGSGIKPSSSAQLFFFETDGTTPKDTYTTKAATVANANPVIADSNGVFSAIYITGDYLVTLKDKNDSQIFGLAPVEEFSVGDFETNLINDLSQAYIFDTVALFKASLIEFPDGKTIKLIDRDANFTKISGTGTANTFNIIASTSVSQSIELDTTAGFFGHQFGMAFDWNGSSGTDDTAAFQAVLDAAVPTRDIVQLKSGRTLITDSISCPTGTKWNGVKENQYDDGFGVDPGGTIIEFQPATTKDLFVTDGTATSGFRLHYYMGNAFIRGGANSNIAIDLNSVIYSKFENIAINGFDGGVSCDATINNRFENWLYPRDPHEKPVNA